MIHYKISYAQNFEDLLLAGILRNVSNGFYIDVGANHHELDSVTKIFYDKGWSGINIEPNSVLHAELAAARPRDKCLRVGVSSQTGSLVFRSYDALDGLSTFSQSMKSDHGNSRPDASFTDTSVAVKSLNDIISEYRPSGDIHFLKIDVEGMELEVLLGNRWDLYRPWVLCIERALDAGRRAAGLSFLAAHGYDEVFFDGINDILVARERSDLWTNFSYARDVIMNGVPVYYIFIKHKDQIG